MTDTEAVRLCAEAMGIPVVKTRPYYGPEADSPESLSEHWLQEIGVGEWQEYDPFINGEQCLALVERFVRVIVKRKEGDWSINLDGARDADFRRAIVICCAKAQAAKGLA